MPKLLTKTKYLYGLQCPKYLWIAVNDKDSLPKPDEQQQNTFDQGTKVGELATKLFPDGIGIPEADFMQNLRMSKELIKERMMLFEPAFMVDSLYSRADILRPANEYEWDIIEVKSGTKVKDQNVQDLSFQKYVYEKAGLKIRNCYLMHINNQYVRNGELDIGKLFVMEDKQKKSKLK